MTDLIRCPWGTSDPMMIDYHDDEWGKPVRDSRALWEKLMLDGFQAGLSWRIVLKKGMPCAWPSAILYPRKSQNLPKKTSKGW